MLSKKGNDIMLSKKPAAQQPSIISRYNFFMPLEPRIMFDAAAAATAEAATNDSDHAGDNSGDAVDTASQHEVAFVDASLQNSAELFKGLEGQLSNVVVLQDGKDPLAQITEYLASQNNVTALHLFSHGTPGSVKMGDTVLSSDTISNHAQQLESWKQSLTADADILLYGCDIAQGAEGEAFINQLATITGADIAASTDATGTATKGGNWVLESKTGPIEAGVLAVTGFEGLLDDALRVESIVRQTPTAETTNATSVKYLVTFSESVSGVTADSFVIAPGSISGATVQLVEKINDKQYQVTIGNLPKDVQGTLNIDIADSNSIKSTDGSKDLINLDTITDDHSYIIDTAINDATVDDINLGNISGNIITTSGDASGHFTLSGTADPKDTVRFYINNQLKGTVTTDNSGNWSFTYSGDALTAGNHTLMVRNSDAAGNSKSVNYTLTIDTSAPDLATGTSSGTMVSDIIAELTFNEALDKTGVPAATDFIVSDGTNTYDVTRIAVDGSIVRLTLSSAVASGSNVKVSYSGENLKDIAGNKVQSFADKELENKTNVSNYTPTISGTSFGNGTNSTWYSYGEEAQFVFGTRGLDQTRNITLVDNDDTHLEKAVVTITTNKNVADQLTIAQSVLDQYGLEASYNNGVLIITGHATKADYANALMAVKFSTTAGKDAARTITLTVNDGQVDSAAASRTLHVLGNAFPVGETTTAYLVGNAKGKTSQDIVGVNLVMGTIDSIDKVGGGNFDDFSSSTINALGFNPIDGHLYASLNSGTKGIIRFDAETGTFVKIVDYSGGNGPASSASINSADIDNNGVMWLSASGTLYRYDLNPESSTYKTWLSKLTITGDTDAGSNVDMAFTQDGRLFTAHRNKIYEISTSPNASNQVTATEITGISLNGNTIPSSNPMQYFDTNGYFYFTNGGTTIYRINVIDSTKSDFKKLDKITAGSTLPSTGDAGRIVTINLDFGDAPNTYKTDLGDGARHNLLGSKVWLGDENSRPSAETDGKADTDADTDDFEDAVTFPTLRSDMTSYSVDVIVNNDDTKDATLCAWIDWNGDGKFSANERAQATVAAGTTNGTVTLTWTGLNLTDKSNADTFARFRIATDWTGTTGNDVNGHDDRSYGPSMDGEVEDYKIHIEAPDTTAPTVTDISIVTGGDGPRSTPVGVVEVKFSESVIKVDYRDFVLTRNGVVVPIPADTPITGSGDTWHIDLSRVTSPTGEYTLTVKDGTGDGITDDAGNHLSNEKAHTFYIDNTAPIIDLDTGSDSRDWAADSTDGTKVSLDNNAAPGEIVEKGISGSVAGSGIKNIQMTVSGLRDGTDEKLIFNNDITKKADGSDGTSFTYTIDGLTVAVSYSDSKFTFSKDGGGLLTEAEASAILRSIEYQNAKGDESSAGKRTFSFTAEDNAGVKAEPAKAIISVTGSGTAGPDIPTVNETISNQPNPTLTGEAKVPQASGGELTVTVDKGGTTPKEYTWKYGEDNTSNPLQYDPNTNTWTLNIPPEDGLPDGVYDVEAKVTDSDSNISYDITEGELTIDTLPPAEPHVNGDSLITHDTTPVITGTANVLNGETLSVTVADKTYTEGDGHLIRNNENWTLTITDNLEVKNHDVEITVTDAAGNSTTNNTSLLQVKPVVVSNPTVNEASGYAVFEVTVLPETNLTLVMADGNATGNGVDYGSGFEYFNGTTWVAYSAGAVVTADSSGKLLVRTPIINDNILEGDETFKLIATPVYGSESIADNTGTGTATIKDDGTGDIFDPDTGDKLNPGDPGYPANGLDDDRQVSVNNITVNEASPYGVFEVTVAENQKVTLQLDGVTATLTDDFGPNLQYSTDGGSTWQDYTNGDQITVGNKNLLVRTPIVNDNILEGDETFTLTVTPDNGTAKTGTATIKDEGAGDIYNPDGSKDTSTPKDDDRQISVNDITVNEASPYGVFTIRGSKGQKVQLELGGEADTATDGGVDYSTDSGSGLEYWDGSQWQTYTSGSDVEITSDDGTLLVRTPIVQDSILEGDETFIMTVTPNDGYVQTGTATINDAGEGTVWVPSDPSNPDESPLVPYIKDPDDPENIIPDPDQYEGTPPPTTVPPTADNFDDDRQVSVNDITVNEASPYGVFEVTVAKNQKVTLSLSDGSTNPATGGGVDYGSTGSDNLQYSLDGGKTWNNYTAGDQITSGDKNILVRTPIVNDDILEGNETFTLTVTPDNGTAKTGTATIKDDGTGTIWVPVDPSNPGSEPTDPTDPNLELVPVDPTTPGAPVDPNHPDGPKVPVPDDDRPVTINDITVNEASEYGVFKVEGPIGQQLTFDLVDGTSSPATGGGVDYGTETGSGLEYSTDGGTTWHEYDGTPVENVSGTVLVRTPIVDDDIPEDPEVFELKVTPLGGQTQTGTATIKDDGTGDILDPNTGDPLNPGDPGYPVDGPNNDHNQPPVAADDNVHTDEDVPLVGNLLDNDTDPDEGDLLVITQISVGGNDYPITEETPAIIVFDGGTLIVNHDGSYTFTPEENWHGEVPTVIYTVSDGKGGEDTADLKITVDSVNDNPVAVDPNDPANPSYPEQNFDPESGNYNLTTPEDTPVDGKVTGTDVDGDELTYVVTTPPTHGTVTIDENTGNYTYTPDPDYNGEDEFTVEINDGNGGKTTSKVEITVIPVADASDDTARIVAGETVKIPVLDNDNFDGNNPQVSVKPQDLPKHGKVTVNTDGSINYTADPDFSGTDTFTYTVTSNGAEETAKVTVTVASPPPPPAVEPPTAQPEQPPTTTPLPEPSQPIVTPPTGNETAIPGPAPVWTPPADVGSNITVDEPDSTPSYINMPIFTINGVVVQGGDDGRGGDNGLYLVKTPSSQIILVDEIGSFNLPTGTFRHSEADAKVALEATLADGRPLPNWLTFDADSGRFVGKPPKDASGVVDLKVTARDDKGNVAHTQFLLRVTSEDSNEAQTVQDADEQDNATEEQNEQEQQQSVVDDMEAMELEQREKMENLFVKPKIKGRPSLAEQLRQQQPRSKQADLLASLQYVVAKRG
ncbi:MAG: DUF4347 domain-containing protein [Trichlorobacter sp.]|nr:DUF4347 domain-containing protein [Trichlorobacter sp.]